MNSFIKKNETKSYKTLCRLVTFTFIFSLIIPPVPGFAQSILNLPAPGIMITPSASFSPPVITGITIHPENPLQLDFIITTGDNNLQGEEFRKESQKLINYFLATLTVPNDEMWVNLSPYEENRIIADGLGKTEMGRDMLIQDYMLKQLTASLMYPEEELGDEFWQRIYEKSQSKFGTTEIPANTFNKVWIVPEEATVYVNGTNAFIGKSHLNVMLEEDYLALESNIDNTKHGLGKMSMDNIEVMSTEAKELIREIILPEIEKEVNEGKNFANLRQIYHSMILATWYKKNLKQSVLGYVYMDKNKINGIDLEDKQIKEKIYNQYVKAFNKGVYDYIREDFDPVTQEIVSRKYFSGGLENAEISESKEAASLPYSSDVLKATRGEINLEKVTLQNNFTNKNREIIETKGIGEIRDSDNSMLSKISSPGVNDILINVRRNVRSFEIGRDSFAKSFGKRMQETVTEANEGDPGRFTLDLWSGMHKIMSRLGLTTSAIDTEEMIIDGNQFRYLGVRLVEIGEDGALTFIQENMGDFVDALTRHLNIEYGLQQDGTAGISAGVNDILSNVKRKVEHFKGSRDILAEVLGKRVQEAVTAVNEGDPGRFTLDLWSRMREDMLALGLTTSAIDTEEMTIDSNQFRYLGVKLGEFGEDGTLTFIQENMGDFVDALTRHLEIEYGLQQDRIAGISSSGVNNILSNVKRKVEHFKGSRDIFTEVLGKRVQEAVTVANEGDPGRFTLDLWSRMREDMLALGLTTSAIDTEEMTIDGNQFRYLGVRLVEIGEDGTLTFIQENMGDFVDALTRRLDVEYGLQQDGTAGISAGVNNILSNVKRNVRSFETGRDSFAKSFGKRVQETVTEANEGDRGRFTLDLWSGMHKIMSRLELTTSAIDTEEMIIDGNQFRYLGVRLVEIGEDGTLTFIQENMGDFVDALTRYLKTEYGLKTPIAIAQRDDSRGWDGLPNDEYTDGIRTALINENFSSFRLQKLDTQVDPAVIQAGFELNRKVVNKTGQEREAGTIAAEQQVKLNVMQSVNLANAVKQIGIQEQLSDIIIVFIPGQRPHYSVGRNQIFLDTNLLNDPEALQQRLNHELTERTDVINGLSEKLRSELERTLQYPEQRSEELRTEIVRLGKESHDRLLVKENRVGGIDFNPETLNLKEHGQQLGFTMNNAMLQNIPANSVEGILPMIINITPITNFAPLLGSTIIEPSEEQQLSMR